jgi:hypothetical protein
MVVAAGFACAALVGAEEHVVREMAHGADFDVKVEVLKA